MDPSKIHQYGSITSGYYRRVLIECLYISASNCNDERSEMFILMRFQRWVNRLDSVLKDVAWKSDCYLWIRIIKLIEPAFTLELQL